MCQNNDINFIATLGTTWSCDRWHRHLLVTNWGGHLAWRPMPGALHPQDVLSTLVAILPSFQNINFCFKNDFGTRLKPYSKTPNCSMKITWFPGAAMSWWMHWFSHVDRGLRFETVKPEQNRRRPQAEPGKTSNVNIYETYMKDLSWLCHDFKVFPSWWGLTWWFVQTCFPTCYLPMLWCCTGIRVELLAQIIQLHVCLTRIWSGCLPVSQNLNLQSHSCATWA